jgi:nicotinamidase/pyrazinamidase
VEGPAGSAVVSALAPEPGDVVVEKRSWSGFFRTNLDAVLRRHGVGSLSIAGCGTNMGLLHTAADAAMRGYEVSVEEALAAGLDAKSHRFALGHMEKVLGVKVDGR